MVQLRVWLVLPTTPTHIYTPHTHHTHIYTPHTSHTHTHTYTHHTHTPHIHIYTPHTTHTYAAHTHKHSRSWRASKLAPALHNLRSQAIDPADVDIHVVKVVRIGRVVSCGPPLWVRTGVLEPVCLQLTLVIHTVKPYHLGRMKH